MPFNHTCLSWYTTPIRRSLTPSQAPTRWWDDTDANKRREFRSTSSKKHRLSKTLLVAAAKNSSGILAPFPINLSIPLHFTWYTEERFFHGTENTRNAIVWNLKLQNGMFTLSVDTQEGEFGRTYEASFEGLYKIEEFLPTLSEAPVINFPTSHTSQATVVTRLCLSIHSFESKKNAMDSDSKNTTG